MNPRTCFLNVSACLLTALLTGALTDNAAAQSPQPDPTGAFAGAPSDYTYAVPGFTPPPAALGDDATAADREAHAQALADYSKPEAVAANLTAVANAGAKAYYSINFVWTLVAAFLVMFMQAGFALVETGLCRAKNAAHVMTQNFFVYAMGMFGFFVCGFAFLCGGLNSKQGTDSVPIGGSVLLGGVPTLDSMAYITVGDKPWGLFGTEGFFLAGDAYDASVLVLFIFMMVFMDTTATIPTGALAERWKFTSFVIFSFFVGALIYPIYACWIWGGGWLAQLGVNYGIGHGVVDYAGSSVVHLQGGAMALIACYMLGARLGKFDEQGRPRPIVAHHVPMVIVGTFILAFGWFGFNAGSSLGGTDGRIGVTAVNTMLASAAGAIVACAVTAWKFGKPDPTMMCNGMLAGLVAITAPCAFVAPWAAFVIGGLAGVIVVFSVFFWESRGLDDPVGAISVHGVNGLWGMLALGIFADGTYGAGWNMADWYRLATGQVVHIEDASAVPAGAVAVGVTGLLYGNPSQLAAQFIGCMVCIAWNVVVAGVVFWVIGKLINGNRVSADVEMAGLDVAELGIPGYSEFVIKGSTETYPDSGPPSSLGGLPDRSKPAVNIPRIPAFGTAPARGT